MASLTGMSDVHRLTLTKNRVYLVKQVTMSGLLSYLLQEEVISDRMKDDIEANSTRPAKVEALLDLLPRRDSTAFPKFLKALRETEQAFIAEKLENFVANVTSDKAEGTDQEHETDGLCASKPANREYDEVDNKVKGVKKTDVEKLLSNKEDPVYPMGSRPRGRALIINNQYFVAHKRRDGAQVDLHNLNVLFTNLGFTVDEHENCSAEEIKEIIKTEATNTEHLNSDCFICFILSHGCRGSVVGTDGKKVSIERDIIPPLDNDKCTSLKGKPKIFFFQACQNEPIPPQSDDCGLSQQFEGLDIQDDSMPPISHPLGDTILAYSTVPGYKSWRSPESGSWFVTAIFDIFTESAHKLDLISMLRRVRDRVLETHGQYHKDLKFHQLTETVERVTKRVFFFPGYYKCHESQSGNRGSP